MEIMRALAAHTKADRTKDWSGCGEMPHNGITAGRFANRAPGSGSSNPPTENQPSSRN